MTKTKDKIVLDFTGTSEEAAGPINWPLDYSDGRFIRKFIAPVLRSLADSPERAAEIDSNEGVLDVIEVKFPEKGTLITPTFGKPTGMRFFLFLRVLGTFAGLLAKATGGRMPADHETIRIWGLHGGKTNEDFYLFREVLGGGGPGRPWADGSDVVHIVPNSRNLPVEFSETRFPIRIEQLGLAMDSGGAGYRRGGFGYDKRVRALQGAKLLSNADRSKFGCVGVNGGQYGKSYGVSILNGDGTSDAVEGMSDTLAVPAGGIVRIVTTGGGGWGDPLEREPEMVCYDVLCGLVSEKSAREDYGVVLSRNDKAYEVDQVATKKLRAEVRESRSTLPMFDRGPYFEEKLQAGEINWPQGWENPDADCIAVEPKVVWKPHKAA
jgi:N-methylhydantoinase B